METNQFRAVFNIVASTLAEAGEAPEGIIYAGIMHAGATLADYERIRAMLVDLGLATIESGPMLKATPKLMDAYRQALAKAAGRPAGPVNGASGGHDHGGDPS